ncbi:MAG: tetratricopeptide repeat protein [Nitrospirota bacterium]
MNKQKILKSAFFVFFFVFVFALFSVEIRDSDFWWHLKTGEYISKAGALPSTDPFSYTSLARDPVNPESKRITFILRQYWLAQTIFYWIYSLSGFQGIILMRASLLTLLILLLYRSVRREGVGLYFSVALLVPVVLVFSANFTGERPQLFSFLFSFLVIFLLEGFRLRSQHTEDRPQENPGNLHLWYLVPLPLLTLLWANLHGGFFIGNLIILGYLISESVKYKTKRFGKRLPISSLKALGTIGSLALIFSFINPNGFNVVSILVELEQSRYKGTIIEAMSPFAIGMQYADVALFFVFLMLGVILLMINFRKLDLTDMMLFSGLAFMGLNAVRFIPFFMPYAILLIARYGMKKFESLSFGQKTVAIRNTLGAMLAFSLVVLIIFMSVRYDIVVKNGVRADKYPEGASRFIRENGIEGNMFNPYYWGGYLIWALYPQHKVFIDGRGLIEDVYFQYLNVFQAKQQLFEGMPEWKAVLKAYRVDYIITFSVDRFTGNLVPLIPALYHDPEWHLVYMDKISLVFLKESSGNRRLIEQFGLPKDWLWGEVVTEALVKAKDSPRRANFYITIGDAFMAKKSYLDARAAYERVLQEDPANPTVQERLQFLDAYGY